MAKNTDKKINIKNSIKKYLAVLKENNINPRKVYLFGSYAKRKFDKDSDIDLAIVSDDLKGHVINDMVLLMKFRNNIDIRIEPHPFLSKEFNKSNPFVREIIETGIKIK